jgi:hypothetical protein
MTFKPQRISAFASLAFTALSLATAHANDPAPLLAEVPPGTKLVIGALRGGAADVRGRGGVLSEWVVGRTVD